MKLCECASRRDPQEALISQMPSGTESSSRRTRPNEQKSHNSFMQKSIDI